MEDKVPFKTYTYWKDQVKPEVRRFGIEKSVVTSFCYLDAKLREVYPGLKQKRYTVSWRDEEGDDVTISSDEEMIIALSAMTENLMKLNVYCMDQEPLKDIDSDIVITATTEGASGDNNVPHLGVICDNCDAEVVGFRYKCTSCADYDLCSKCESAGHHAEHIMVRLPMPNMPRTTIRTAIRRSRHIMKAVASTMIEQECPYKKQRRDKNIETNCPHSRPGESSRDDHYQRRCRTSWLETFATYMNEFANLAGDIDTETDKNKNFGPKPANSKPKKQTEMSNEDNTQSAKQPEPTASNERVNQCPFSFDNGGENIQNLLKTYGMNLNTILTKLTPPQEPTNVENKDNNKTAEVVCEADESDTSDASSTNKEVVNDYKKDESPERAPDDWTVINKEKDLMESDGQESTQTNLKTPMRFKLPEDFQKHVNISEGQSLYPPLHAASAEPEPTSQGPSEPKVVETVKQKITPPISQAKPQSQPRQIYHHQAHIDAAIEQMLSMGFTNDGDWLTQLLESKDGNIAAVLDLLTPVNPKK